jgi:HK97 gp10 family phage protein
MPRLVTYSGGYAAAKNRRWEALVGGRKTSFRLSRGSNVDQTVVNQRDIQKVINKLKRLPKEYQGSVLKKVLRRNAKAVVKAAKGNVPVAKKTVKRYINGKVVATYTPGNLKRSIGVLPLRKTSSVFVGPRAGERYKNDGWYGHFVENGTAFQKGVNYMHKAYLTTKNVVLDGIKRDVQTILKQYIRKNKIR